MTTNQAILLMDIYRGLDEDRHPATLPRDLHVLQAKDLIRADNTFGWRETLKGNLLVNTMLSLANLVQ